jgi:hypothetical protein
MGMAYLRHLKNTLIRQGNGENRICIGSFPSTIELKEGLPSMASRQERMEHTFDGSSFPRRFGGGVLGID